MVDRFLRLIIFLLDICTPLMKQFLAVCAKETMKTLNTDKCEEILQEWLRKVKTTGKLKNLGLLKFQIDAIYGAGGDPCVENLDISALSALITTCHRNVEIKVENDELQATKDIRETRNEMQHRTNTDVSEEEFENSWEKLTKAALILSTKCCSEDIIQKQIENAKTRVIVGTEKKILERFFPILTALRSVIDSIKDDTTNIRNKLDSDLDLLRDKFKTIYEECTSWGDLPVLEIDQIKSHLTKQGVVLVTGISIDICRYASMLAFEGICCDCLNQCVALHDKTELEVLKKHYPEVRIKNVLYTCAFETDLSSDSLTACFDSLYSMATVCKVIVIANSSTTLPEHKLLQCRVKLTVENFVITTTKPAGKTMTKYNHMPGWRSQKPAPSLALFSSLDCDGLPKEFSPTGLTFVSGNRLAVVDHANCKCLLLNTSIPSIMSELASYSFNKDSPSDICTLPGDRVAVTTGKKQVLYILSVQPDSTIVLTAKLGVTSRYKSISYMSEENGFVQLAVGNYDTKPAARIIHLSLDKAELQEGDFSETMSIPDKKYTFKGSCLTYIKTADTLVLTDRFAGKVYVINKTTRERKEIIDSRLDQPRGACAGPKGSLFICNNRNNTLVHMDLNGCINDLHPVSVSPRAICMSSDGHFLAVSYDMEGCKEIQLFELQMPDTTCVLKKRTALDCDEDKC